MSLKASLQAILLSLGLANIQISHADDLQTKQLVQVQTLIVQWDQSIADIPDDLLSLNDEIEVHLLNLSPFSKRTIKPVKVTFPTAYSADKVKFLLRKLEAIKTIEKEQQASQSIQPDDPLFSSQEHHTLINSEQAWDTNSSCNLTKVAVLDSGIDLDHTDLVENIWVNSAELDNGIDDDNNGLIDDIQGWDFVNNTNMPDDDNGHGTHVSGIVAAKGNNFNGVSGVCWNAQLMPIKVLRDSGTGNLSTIQQGIDYAAAQGARVIVLSLVFNQSSPSLLATMRAAEQEHDVLFVVAAGNNGKDIDKDPIYPASYSPLLDNTMAVANVDNNFERNENSNFGAQTLDISAPGTGIFSTWRNNNYIEQTGTSMSAPMVAGAAALLWSINPELSAAEVRSQLINTNRNDSGSEWLSKSAGTLNLSDLYSVSDNRLNLFNFAADSETQLEGFGLSQTEQVEYVAFTTGDVISYDVSFNIISDNLITLDFAASRPGYYVAKGTNSDSNRLVSWVAEQPETPTNITVEENGSGFAISWSSSNLAETYIVERNIDGTWTQLDSVNSTTNIYFDESVPDYEVLQYRLLAAYNYIDPTTGDVEEELSEYSDAVAPNGEIFAGAWLTKELAQVPLDYDFINIRLQTNTDEDISFSLSTGNLPNSLRLSDEIGHIVGPPEEEGTFNFSVTYTNRTGTVTGTRQFTLVVADNDLDLLNEPNQDIQMNFDTSKGQFTSLQSKSVVGEEFESVRMSIYNFDKNLSSTTISADPYRLSGGTIGTIHAQLSTGGWVTLDNSDNNLALANGLSWIVEDNSIYDHNPEENLIEVDFSINWQQIPTEDNSGGDTSGGGGGGGGSTTWLSLLMAFAIALRIRRK
ncbi:S8 family serine peptidase [Catenovulum sp. SM1970]|uniref:S8 family serine peptidase n=1 Tax=Marinifaba aquimaris TaxID=2741323 RepID=UPI001574CCCD|nr:S8 family serine peptidase [Marinifaba aquimaris]NTS77273.1 S8 family serine peptidase [Marinifaba aquimaris]